MYNKLYMDTTKFFLKIAIIIIIVVVALKNDNNIDINDEYVVYVHIVP